MNLKDYIVTEADKLFSQYGFKSVTMDDIAKHLGMSKKTIYQHYANKDELVVVLIKQEIQEQTNLIEKRLKNSENAVHEVMLEIAYVKDFLITMNPILFYDLQKYHTKAWLLYVDFREKIIAKAIQDNLKRGVEENLYRKEIEIDILAQFRIEQINIVFNSMGYNTQKYSLAQIMTEIIKNFLYGVCNTNGLKKIAKYQQRLTIL